MSIDRTLHIKSGVSSRRNVLKRSERITRMQEEGLFDEESASPMGLAKTRVRVRRAVAKTKKEEPTTEALTPAEGEAQPEGTEKS